jgi:hypothetical protein
MDDDRLDLSGLDPTGDEARFARLVSGTLERARPELLRRAVAPNPWGTLAHWMRPMLAAAAITALLAGTVLTATLGGNVNTVATVAAAQPADLRALVDDWVTENRTPSVSDLMLALDEDFR